MPRGAELYANAKTMYKAKTPLAARTILGRIAMRVASARFIGWPALEQSWTAELEQARAVAMERGLL